MIWKSEEKFEAKLDSLDKKLEQNVARLDQKIDQSATRLEQNMARLENSIDKIRDVLIANLINNKGSGSPQPVPKFSSIAFPSKIL